MRCHSRADTHDYALPAQGKLHEKEHVWGLHHGDMWGADRYNREGTPNLHAETTLICTLPYTKYCLWKITLYCPDGQHYTEWQETKMRSLMLQAGESHGKQQTHEMLLLKPTHLAWS